MMRIAVLSIKRDGMEGYYPKDWEGRDRNNDMESVVRALRELGHEVKAYHVDIDLFERLKRDKADIDLVFNLCDDGFFYNSELEPHLPAMLDVLGIPYTGGNYLTLALTLNKDIAKKVLVYHKLPTPRFQVFETGDEALGELNFPLIVKPVHEDASIGIKDESVVRNEGRLRGRVRYVIEMYRQPALVEEFIDGREFNVGVVGNNEILPLSEITFDGLPEGKPRLVNYAAKWKKGSVDYKETKRSCPAKVDDGLGNRMRELALKAASLLGCRDYFRVDFRVDKDNQPYILEVNQNPDISEDSGLFAMAKVKGYTYKELINKIVKSAIKRKDDNTK